MPEEVVANGLIDYKEFATQIKAKYPSYQSVDDSTLAAKIIEKYPVYKDRVSFGQQTTPQTKPIPGQYSEWQNEFDKTQSIPTQPDPIPKDKNTFLPEMGARITKSNADLGSMISKVPGFIYDVASIPQNILAEKLNAPEWKTSSKQFAEKLGLENKVAEYFDNGSDYYAKKIADNNPKYQQGVVESISNGDWEAAGRNLLGGILESSAPSIAMMASAGLGAPAMIGAGTAVFGAGKKAELDENAPQMSEQDKTMIALSNGAIEGLFETALGAGAMGSALKNVVTKSFAEGGEQLAKQNAKKFIDNTFVKMLEKNPELGMLGEGLEEVGTQFSQNAVDKYSGYRPDINLSDGAADAFLMGVGMGGMMAAPIKVAKYLGEKKNVQSTIESNLNPLVNPSTGNLHVVKMRGKEEDTDPNYFITQTTAGGMVNIVDQDGNNPFGKPISIDDLTTEQIFSPQQAVAGDMQDWEAGKQAEEQQTRLAEVQQQKFAKIPQQFDWDGSKYSFDATDPESVLTDEEGNTFYKMLELDDNGKDFGVIKSFSQDEVNKVIADNTKEQEKVAAEQAKEAEKLQAEQQKEAEKLAKENQNATSVPSGDNNLSERKIIPQDFGNTTIDIIEEDGYDEIVPSEKMPLEKILPILEKEFKDNPKFKVEVEKSEVTTVTPKKNKYGDDIVTKKTVIKGIKIVPRPVYNTIDPATGKPSEPSTRLPQEKRIIPIPPAYIPQTEVIDQKPKQIDPEEQAIRNQAKREKKIERARILKSEPLTSRDAILQYFLSGGKVDPSLINKEIIGKDREGKLRSESERKGMFWMTKGGEATDTDQLEHILHGTQFETMLEDPTAFRNEVLDVLSLGSPSRMMEELSKSIGTGQQEQYSPEEIQRLEAFAEQQAKSDKIEYDNQLSSIFDEQFKDNITDDDFVNLFYEFEPENGSNTENTSIERGDQPEDTGNIGENGQNPIGDIEVPRAIDQSPQVPEQPIETESQTERFDLKPTETIQDLQNNINSILEQYSGREMAAIQAEKYMAEFRELGKQYLSENNINSSTELKSHFAKLQSKVREGKGKERQESKKQFDELKAQQNVDAIIDMALKADAEMQRQIEESELQKKETEPVKNEPDVSRLASETPVNTGGSTESGATNLQESNTKEEISLPKDEGILDQIANIGKSDKVIALEKKRSLIVGKKEKAINEVNQRNEIFGDAKADPNNPLDKGFDPSQALKQQQGFDAEIARIDKQIEDQKKLEATGKKENKGQQELVIPETPKESEGLLDDIAAIAKKGDNPIEKIEDFGEKIGGAKKDLIRKYFDKINLDGKILSVVFPKPDVKSLLESGMSVKDVSGIKVAHEFAVQDKKRGIETTKFYAAYAKNILAKSIDLEFKNNSYEFTDFGKSQIELRTKAYQDVYEKLGAEYLSLDLTKVRIRVPDKSGRSTYYQNGEPIKDSNYIVSYYVSASKHFMELSDAIDYFTEQVKANTKIDEVVYKRKLNIYYDKRIKGEFYIGYPSKGDVIKLKDGFKSSKEAFEELRNPEIHTDLQTMLERIMTENRQKSKPAVRLKYTNETARERVGKDWRNGKDVGSKELAETFGFRAIEFGNWVNQKERQVFMNNTYDSLMDLSQLLNFSPKSISLAGNLGITFGSRGSGNAAAHYESGRKIINLTKTQGLGSLAHEWWHAIDNYFAGFETSMNGMKAASATKYSPETRDEVKKSFDELYKAVSNYSYKQRSQNLDGTKNAVYFSLPHEMSARAFENYMLNRLAQSGQVNDFIVNYVSDQDWNGEANKYPYPKAEESVKINESFQQLFDTIQEKEENGNSILFEPTTPYDKEEINIAYGNEENRQAAIDNIVKELESSPLLGVNEPGISNAGGRNNSDGSLRTGNPLLEKIKPRTVLEGFKESGYVDVVGQKVTNLQDIADLWTVHRSPYIEKAHVIFVKDGVIVGSSALTCNRANQTMFFTGDEVVELSNKYGTNDVYYLHNHPSGNHKTSLMDIQMTLEHKSYLRKNGISLKGHIVIDHDKFSYINGEKLMNGDPRNQYDLMDYQRKQVEEHDYKNAVPKLFSEREKLPEGGYAAQERLMEISKALLTENSYPGAIIYISNKNEINAYDVFPEGATVQSVIDKAKESLNNNIGTRVAFVHDGRFEKWGVVPNETIDVINAKGMYSEDFYAENGKGVTLEDRQLLWEPQTPYGKPNMDKSKQGIAPEKEINRVFDIVSKNKLTPYNGLSRDKRDLSKERSELKKLSSEKEILRTGMVDKYGSGWIGKATDKENKTFDENKIKRDELLKTINEETKDYGELPQIGGLSWGVKKGFIKEEDKACAKYIYYKLSKIINHGATGLGNIRGQSIDEADLRDTFVTSEGDIVFDITFPEKTKFNLLNREKDVFGEINEETIPSSSYWKYTPKKEDYEKFTEEFRSEFEIKGNTDIKDVIDPSNELIRTKIEQFDISKVKGIRQIFNDDIGKELDHERTFESDNDFDVYRTANELLDYYRRYKKSNDDFSNELFRQQLLNEPKSEYGKPKPESFDSPIEFAEAVSRYAKQSLPSTILVNGVERPTTNSKGQPIAETEEKVRNFWNWFSGSKVVDKDGKPLVVYHGTRADFNQFKPSGKTGNQGEKDQIEGMYFTDNRDGAEFFALTDHPKYLKEAYLSIQNPFKSEGIKELKESLKLDALGDVSEKVKSIGNDGLIIERGFYAKGGPWRKFITFNPTQIKSSTGNNGNFSENNPSIVEEPIGEYGASNLDKAEEATTRMDNLNIAREMEDSGKDEKSIRLATGWEKGGDGLWRYEIHSGKLIGQAARDTENENSSNFGHNLGSIIDSEVLKAYPQLNDVKVIFESAEINRSHGSWIKQQNTIHVASGPDDKLSILTHEIQHAIQDIEGFAEGGSPSRVAKIHTELDASIDFYNDLLSKASKEGNTVLYDKLMNEKLKKVKEIQKLEGEFGNKNTSYRRLAGEVESRNAQSRLNFTPEQRRNTLLSETEDVSRKDQIFLRGNLGVSESRPNSANYDSPIDFAKDLSDYTNTVNEPKVSYAKKTKEREDNLSKLKSMQKKALNEGDYKLAESITKKIDAIPPTSVNPDVDARLEAARGLERRSLLDSLKKWIEDIKESTHHFKYVTQKEFPTIYNKLRLFEAIPDRAKKEALDKMMEIVKPVFKNDNFKVAFEKNIVLRDLLYDINTDKYEGKELPWGYESIEEIKKDVANLNTYIFKNSTLSKAVQARDKMMAEVRDRLVENNLLGASSKENKTYFHHQVLQYMNEKVNPQVGVASRDVRLHKKGWQRSRTGSMLDYNTNYLESEFEVLAQSLVQIETKELLNQIGEQINIMPKLVEQANEEGGKWRDYVPEGYRPWYPKSGTNAYKAASMAEKAVQNLLNDPASPELLDQLAEAEGSMWVIPEKIADQMNDMKSPEKEMWFPQALRFMIGKWKQWILFNPYNFLKYNFNNLSGDLDIVLASNPAILKPKYAWAATKEAWADFRGKPMSNDMKEALAQGVITSGITIQEIPDINQEMLLKSITRSKGNPFRAYWGGVTGFSQFRENVLRVAAYKYFKEQTELGKKHYAASDSKSIDALWESGASKEEIAGKLSRELLGDYGNLSQGGQWLRSHSFPFWSWVEVNAPRYYRLIKNVAAETNNSTAGNIGKVAAIGAKKSISLALRVTLLMALVTLWNRLRFPDEDDELTRNGNRKLMLIVGRRDDGSIMTVKIQGAFSDVLSFVGLEDAPEDARDVIEGDATVGKKAKEAGNALINKFAQGAMPLTKALAEVTFGKQLYPDILNPRPVRDRVEQGLKTVKFDKIYRYLTKKPMKAFGKEVTGLLFYDNNPGEIAYYTMRQKIYDFLDEKEIESPSGEPTARSNALYYYKQSLKLGDKDLAKYWIKKYTSMGGTKKGMEASIAKGQVISAVPKALRDTWLNSLDGEDKEVLKMANEWYNQTYQNK
jgi:hypothetical protein